jgi:hypothetical protein
MVRQNISVEEAVVVELLHPLVDRRENEKARPGVRYSPQEITL